jgi:chromosome segregation ATPase
MQTQTNHHGEKGQLESRVEFLEKTVHEVRDAVKSIDGSLKELVRLEVAHAETRNGLERAFLEINDHESRLRKIEEDMPTMRMTRGWVITAVIGIVGILGLAVAKMVLI